MKINHPVLPYNPGVLPVKEAPRKGESIIFTVQGLPPINSKRESLRNPRNSKYDRFVNLRNEATKAMNGRAWYFRGIKLNIEIYKNTTEEPGITLNEYVGGVMDSLDGSSGVYFTYLPIVYEDDCQVFESKSQFIESTQACYSVRVDFS